MDKMFTVGGRRHRDRRFHVGLGALMALSKSKKHFDGLTWDDNGKKGGFAFQADKNDYRGILQVLKA